MYIYLNMYIYIYLYAANSLIGDRSTHDLGKCTNLNISASWFWRLSCYQGSLY
jgi:hypothetical protein